jgi:hypothetical protein
VSFITLQSSSPQTGNGRVIFFIDANPGVVPRSGLITIGTAFAVLVSQSASSAVAVLTFRSDSADYIGRGQADTFAVVDFSATSTDPSQLIFRMRDAPFWTLSLSSGNGPLVPGLYNGTARWPFQAPGQPGLDDSFSVHQPVRRSDPGFTPTPRDFQRQHSQAWTSAA